MDELERGLTQLKTRIEGAEPPDPVEAIAARARRARRQRRLGRAGLGAVLALIVVATVAVVLRPEHDDKVGLVGTPRTTTPVTDDAGPAPTAPPTTAAFAPPALPALPAEGLAVGTQAGVVLVDLEGHELASLPGYHLASSGGAPSSAVPLTDPGGRPATLRPGPAPRLSAEVPPPAEPCQANGRSTTYLPCANDDTTGGPAHLMTAVAPDGTTTTLPSRAPGGGGWTAVLPSPDGRTLLAQWSGECEIPIAYFVPATGGTPTEFTGSPADAVPESSVIGWSSAGDAFVAVQPGACGAGHEPGIYARRPGGPLRLVYATPADQPVGALLWTAVMPRVIPAGPAPHPPAALAEQPVENPSALVVGGGHQWVLGNGAVVELDPATAGIRRRIPLAGAFAGGFGDGAVWVVTADRAGAALVRVDAATGDAAPPIALPGPRTRFTLVAPVVDGSHVWAAVDSRLVDVDRVSRSARTTARFQDPVTAIARTRAGLFVLSGGVLFRLDPTGRSVVAQVDLGDGYTGLTGEAGGYDVWAFGQGPVLRLRAQDTAVDLDNTGQPYGWVVASGGQLWASLDHAAGGTGGLVAQLDPITGRVTRTMVFPTLANNGPFVAGVDAGAVWALNAFAGRVYRFVP